MKNEVLSDFLNLLLAGVERAAPLLIFNFLPMAT
jgi:hypothetical protein